MRVRRLVLFCGWFVAAPLGSAWSANPMTTVETLRAFCSTDLQMAWRVYPGNRMGAEDPSTEDSSWVERDLNNLVGFSPPFWLRKTIVIPEHIVGVPLVGGPAHLSLNCLGRVRIYVDGRAVQDLDSESSVIALTNRAYPGRRIVVAVYVRKVAGPLVFRSLDLLLSELGGLRAVVQDLLLDLESAVLLLRLTSGPEEVRWRREFSRAVERVDLEALYARDEGGLAGSAIQTKQALAVLRPLAKEMNVFAAGRTVLDPSGRYTQEQLINANRSVTRGILELLDRFPDLVVCRSEAMAHRWLEELDPSLHRAVVERVNEHRYVLVGGTWSDFDPELAGGESIIRQYLLGKRYFAEVFRQQVQIATFPHVPSAGPMLPEFLAGCGMRGLVLDPPPSDRRSPFPWNLFLWQTPSGVSLLTYCPPGQVAPSPELAILSDLERVHSRHKLRDLGILFDVTGDRRAPDEEKVQRLLQAAARPLFPSFFCSDLDSFIDRLLSNPYGVEYPLYTGRVTVARDPERFAAVPTIRRLARRAESLLVDFEKVSTILSQLTASAYPTAELDELWRTFLSFQRPAVMSGVADTPVLAEARERLALLGEQLQSRCRLALDQLARQVDTASMPHAVLVFNPLSWDRDGAVTVPSPFRDAPGAVKNHWGETVPSQLVGEGDRQEICFLAENVPPLGFKIYQLLPGEPSDAPPTRLAVNDNTVTAQHYRFSIDPETGRMNSLRVAKTDTDLFAPEGGVWLEPFTSSSSPEATGEKSGARVAVTENGPVRVTIRIEKRSASSESVQEIQAVAGQPRIDIHTTVRRLDENRALRLRAATEFFAPVAVSEIAGGVREMKTVTGLRINGPIAGHGWAALASPDAQVGLALLNDGRPAVSYGAHELALALRSSDPTLDFTASVYPYQGDWQSARVYRQAEELSHPFLVVQTGDHSGRLPALHSVAQILPDHVVLKAMKVSGGAGLILRVWEVTGSRGRAEITVASPVISATELTLLEDETVPLQYVDRTVFVPIGPFQVKTVHIVH